MNRAGKPAFVYSVFLFRKNAKNVPMYKSNYISIRKHDFSLTVKEVCLWGTCDSANDIEVAKYN